MLIRICSQVTLKVITVLVRLLWATVWDGSQKWDMWGTSLLQVVVANPTYTDSYVVRHSPSSGGPGANAAVSPLFNTVM